MTRYVDEVTAEHVGRRVTVRRRLSDGSGLSDVVGELRAADDTTFTVVRRSGEQVVVDRAHVVASKLLPTDPGSRTR